MHENNRDPAYFWNMVVIIKYENNVEKFSWILQTHWNNRTIYIYEHHRDIWLFLTLTVGYVDERELHLMRPSPGTVDTGGSPGCQSIFYCRWSPMRSLLHMSHPALKLNVYAAP